MAKTTHYRIHWSDKDELDWEPFKTAAEAIRSGANIVLQGEMFTVEGADENCPRCAKPQAGSKPTRS